jgi:poly(3-hydroxybutyrate) depolymerase
VRAKPLTAAAAHARHAPRQPPIGPDRHRSNAIDHRPRRRYAGGGAPYWQYGAPAAQARWAAVNGCRQGPRTRRVTRHVTQVAYLACRRNADVVMYLVEGGGHTWPGSAAMIPLVPALGPVTFEIDRRHADVALLRALSASHDQPLNPLRPGGDGSRAAARDVPTPAIGQCRTLTP